MPKRLKPNPRLGTDWHVAKRKKPVAYSTTSTADVIGVFAKDHPDFTFKQLREFFCSGEVIYDPEIITILDTLIKYGDGDKIAHVCLNLNGLQREEERLKKERRRYGRAN